MEAESSGGGAPEGWLLIRVHVPELNVQKNLQFPRDQLVWDVKQQCLAALPKELKESFNYGLFCPPVNGKAGKFLDEERRLGDYPFSGSVGYLELKYKRRVYKMLKLDEKALKALHSRANLRRFLDHVTHAHIDKITKACSKGLDPNFHCQETGETPLTMAAVIKSPAKVLIALVNGGALLDYRTKDGSTAMHRAVEKNSLEAVKTLLELGASPNYKDGKALTPLYLSVTNKTDPLLCESLLHDHATIGAQDLQGWQEVHQACRNGLVQHLDHLLFYGADMNGRNASGNTPLHVCAVNGQDSCARQLLFRGCDREALNFANQTPYQVAVIAGNLELAEVIKSFKMDEVVPFRGPPRYNPRRRSGAAWAGLWGPGAPGDRSSVASTLTRIPCELEALLRRPPRPASPHRRPFSSASSSISDTSQPSHEDNASIITDKSLGDTSDIISDSSGVGTSNSDTTTCSVQLPGTAVVCLEPYDSGTPGHLRISQGDIIEVTGTTDDGMLEGVVRGSGGAPGMFPPQCVQEVRLRHHTPSSHESVDGMHPRVSGRREMGMNKTYSATAPRVKKNCGPVEWRTVTLHRGRRGFGFVLRGAKASSPLMELQPSERCPALQYLDDVDAGGAADTAGLRRGDFLVAINDEDVSAASHEHVVELIRKSGALVSMMVVTLRNNGTNTTTTCTVPTSKSVTQLSSGVRPFATLPRKATGGRSPAPAPPRRDPRTTLSVGRARAKSMVAGLENGGEKDECVEQLTVTGKCNSAESVQQHTSIISNGGTPVAGGTPAGGTPVAPRTASIRQRPASSRITAAELEELFQRQQDHADKGVGSSGMMSSSAFHDESGSPPYSPVQPPGRVYASIAEMKRSKAKLWLKAHISDSGTTSSLRRDFHSTPDLAVEQHATPSRVRSSEDVHRAGAPPLHPPPPPPGLDTGAPVSSFRPTDSAKLYASPEDLDPVLYRARPAGKPAVRKASSLRSWSGPDLPAHRYSAEEPTGQYAQPFNQQKGIKRQSSMPAPPIPEPDYSMSESEEEGGAAGASHQPPLPAPLAETSANSNASGSSSGSGSMQHSFSVDEIQKMRTRLKSSKSCPDEFREERDDGDNSSSGVSSDQEARPAPRARDKVSFSASVTVKSSNDVITTEPVQLHSSSESVASVPPAPPPAIHRHNSLTRKQAAAAVMRAAGRGRTAAERLGVDTSRAPGRRHPAVSLAELPPPPEEPAAPTPPPDAPPLAPPPQFSDRVRIVATLPKRVAHLH